VKAGSRHTADNRTVTTSGCCNVFPPSRRSCRPTYLEPREVLCASKMLLYAAQAVVPAMAALHAQPHSCCRLLTQMCQQSKSHQAAAASNNGCVR
jgi:hypothetical protein